jgi:hypothetical protein
MQLAAPRDAFDSGDLRSLASTPSTRQEVTTRSSINTVHAPQFPSLQPSWCGRPSIAQAFEHALARLAQELLRLAIDRGLDTHFVVHQRFPSLAL